MNTKYKVLLSGVALVCLAATTISPYIPPYPQDATKYLNGVGQFTTPAGAVGSYLELSQTNTFATDITNQAKAYTDSVATGGDTNLIVRMATNSAKSYYDFRTTNAWIDIRDFGAVGDNVADDVAAIRTAVDLAMVTKQPIYFAKATNFTSASITNFHNVTKIGPGVVRRGGNLFFVEPKNGQSDQLFVSTTGTANNDGLHTSMPMSTVQIAGNAIFNYPFNNNTWTINLAAGTYTERALFVRQFPSLNRVVFRGPAVADGVRPTAIMQSGGVAGTGITFGPNSFVKIEDIEFQNYNVGALDSGLEFDSQNDAWTQNVWANNCNVGITASAETRFRAAAGVMTNCATGFKFLSHVTYTVGYNGTAASAVGDTGPAIRNCTVQGILAQEGSTGHADYTWFEGCPVGINAIEKSRANIVSSIFTNNAVAVLARVQSSFYMPAANGNTFVANTTNAAFASASMEVSTNQNRQFAWEGEVGSSVWVADAATNATLQGFATSLGYRVYQGALTHAGTVTLDFDGATTVNALTITGNVTFASSNLATNRQYTLRITGASTNSTPTFPAWTFLTGSPSTITANKRSYLTLIAWGTTDATVDAWFQEAP